MLPTEVVSNPPDPPVAPNALAPPLARQPAAVVKGADPVLEIHESWVAAPICIVAPLAKVNPPPLFRRE